MYLNQFPNSEIRSKVFVESQGLSSAKDGRCHGMSPFMVRGFVAQSLEPLTHVLEAGNPCTWSEPCKAAVLRRCPGTLPGRRWGYTMWEACPGLAGALCSCGTGCPKVAVLWWPLPSLTSESGEQPLPWGSVWVPASQKGLLRAGWQLSSLLSFCLQGPKGASMTKTCPLRRL